jgi:hypothetical protein
MGLTFRHDKNWAITLTPTRGQPFLFLHYCRTGNVPNAVAAAQINDFLTIHHIVLVTDETPESSPIPQ